MHGLDKFLLKLIVMIAHIIFILLFSLAIVYTMFNSLKVFIKKTKSEYEKLEMKYNFMLLIILLIALLSRLERSGIINF